MKNNKMIVKIAYAVVGLSIFVLIALNVYQQQQIRKMSVTESSESSANNPPADEAIRVPPGDISEKAAGQKTAQGNTDPDINDLKYHLDAAEEELDMAQEELASELDRKAAFAKNTIALQRQMLQDPATQKLLRTSLANTLDTSYAVLFKKLALSPEKQDAFKELLIDLQLENTDLSTEMLDTSISEEKRREVRQHLETLANESDKKIRELLGAEDNEEYLAYKERLSERMLLTTFLESLGPDEKLTENQQQAFVDSMFEERKRVLATHPLENGIESVTGLDEKQIERAMEMTGQTYSGYAQVAGTYLSPSQAERFKGFLDQRRSMTEMSLSMAQQMFGNNSVSSEPPVESDNSSD